MCVCMCVCAGVLGKLWVEVFPYGGENNEQ